MDKLKNKKDKSEKKDKPKPKPSEKNDKPKPKQSQKKNDKPKPKPSQKKNDKPKTKLPNKKVKVLTKSKKLTGGQNVIGASVDLINSITDLGKNIFHEIYTITHIQDDLNNGTKYQSGIPNNLQGPPPFNPPNL
jgi:hypothetical protein